MAPISGPRRRILVEAADAHLRRAATELLESAGFAVTTCPGPASGRPCPLLAGQPCGIVASADVGVVPKRAEHGRIGLEAGDPCSGLRWPGV